MYALGYLDVCMFLKVADARWWKTMTKNLSEIITNTDYLFDVIAAIQVNHQPIYIEWFMKQAFDSLKFVNKMQVAMMPASYGDYFIKWRTKKMRQNHKTNSKFTTLTKTFDAL